MNGEGGYKEGMMFEEVLVVDRGGLHAFCWCFRQGGLPLWMAGYIHSHEQDRQCKDRKDRASTGSSVNRLLWWKVREGWRGREDVCVVACMVQIYACVCRLRAY